MCPVAARCSSAVDGRESEAEGERERRVSDLMQAHPVALPLFGLSWPSPGVHAGFGLCGVPEYLVAAVQRSGKNNLVCVSNDGG